LRAARRLSPFALVPVLVALTASPRPADAAARACASGPYAYAGLVGRDEVAGVRATISAVKQPAVAGGHVAGWVGVGGTHAGPNGEAAWIQVGLAGFADGTSELYYEITQPGIGTTYTSVVEAVNPGEAFAVAVVELPAKANWWRVEVNGAPVSRAVRLPGSHGTWQATATSETWNPGTRACNRFSYRFGDVSTYRTSSWRPLGPASVLSGRGYGVFARTPSSFVAKSRWDS